MRTLLTLLFATMALAASARTVTFGPMGITNNVIVTNPAIAKVWQGSAYAPVGNEFTVNSGTVLYDVTGLAVWLTDPASVTSVTATGTGIDGSIDGTAFTNWTTIGDNAFDSCSSLTTATIGTNVTSIGDNAFAGCPVLTNLDLNGCANIASWGTMLDGGGTNVAYATNASAYAIDVLTNANWIVNY